MRIWNLLPTRMYSSRMRTARLLTVSQQYKGSTCPGGVYLPRGCTGPGGVPAQGVHLPMGVYLPGGGGVPAQGGYLPRYSPHPVNRMTDRCKNLTLPQTSFAGGNNCTLGWYHKGWLFELRNWMRSFLFLFFFLLEETCVKHSEEKVFNLNSYNTQMHKFSSSKVYLFTTNS